MKMKALVLTAFDRPYQLQEVEKPAAGTGEVLVKIMASGINPLDLKIQAGQAAHAKIVLPAILGIDMAGTIEAVGEGVTEFKVGDQVFGMTGGIAAVQGSLATYASVDADLLALKPSNLTMKEAAALPLIFITAWEALMDRARLSKGKTVLIQGGAGGVGHVAVQIAKTAGAKVFATVNPNDFDLIHSYGAVPIDYHMPEEKYVSQYSKGEGFDIILDTVGGAVLDASFKAAKQYTGHVVSILGWGNHALAPLSFRGATYSGVFTLYPLLSGKNRKQHGDILRKAAEMIERNQLRPIVDPGDYTLETVEAAYDAIRNGNTNGKVVISVQ